MKPDERPHSTYLAHAQAEADLAAGGRFKKETATNVTGIPQYPVLPVCSPWHGDPVPPEPPLGETVDATMVPVGTAQEIERSVAASFPPPMRAPATLAPDGPSVETTDVGVRSFRRRLAP
jgi:hypothetical protein